MRGAIGRVFLPSEGMEALRGFREALAGALEGEAVAEPSWDPVGSFSADEVAEVERLLRLLGIAGGEAVEEEPEVIP